MAKFQGFLLVAEPALGNTAIQSPTSLGTFQLMAGDAMTKFSHRCSHAVESSSAMIKSEITVEYNRQNFFFQAKQPPFFSHPRFIGLLLLEAQGALISRPW